MAKKTQGILNKEPWFDNLASALLLENLAEIAEADRKIEKTEMARNTKKNERDTWTAYEQDTWF